MSTLRSTIDQFRAQPNEDLSAHELAGDLEEIEEAVRLLEATRAAKISAFRCRGGLEATGYPSVTAFLAARCRIAPGRARALAARAEQADRAPTTLAAWIDGRLSGDQAITLLQLSAAVPDEFPEAETRLIEIVGPLSVTDTRRALEYWRQAVDGPGDLALEIQMERRGLSLSRTVGGMRRVEGWMTLLAGEAFEAGLSAHLPPPSPHDQRTPRQRRHDALEEMARCHLDHGNLPDVGCEKPHVTLLADLDAVNGLAGGTHETLNGDIIDLASLLMIVCDCSIARVVLGADSEVVDVGRKTRTWTSVQRRAVVARDRHCTATGCERPPQWCDIHHVIPWGAGGPTSVDNGRLLCRYHHTRAHLPDKHRRERI